MNYWVILGVLVVVALILIVIIVVALMKGKQQGNEEEYPEDYDDEYEEEPGREEPPRRRRKESESADAEDAEEPERRKPAEQEAEETILPAFREKKSKKRQWKLQLENVDSWQKHTYVFYENVGIGRSRSNSVFEKYLSIPDDPRVSKVHCAIIQNDDKLYLKDLGARNGTYLNGKRISQPVLIQRDDVIGLGETRIEIQSIMKEKDEKISENKEDIR